MQFKGQFLYLNKFTNILLTFYQLRCFIKKMRIFVLVIFASQLQHGVHIWCQIYWIRIFLPSKIHGQVFSKFKNWIRSNLWQKCQKSPFFWITKIHLVTLVHVTNQSNSFRSRDPTLLKKTRNVCRKLPQFQTVLFELEFIQNYRFGTFNPMMRFFKRPKR